MPRRSSGQSLSACRHRSGPSASRGRIVMLPVEREPGFVTLTAAAHPFRASRDVLMVREGQSLAEMLHEAQPDSVLRRHATIFIAGHRIDPRHWHRTYPKAGAHVEIRVLPAGGGGGGSKNVLRTVMMVAVMALAIAVPFIAPGMMTAIGAALGASTTVAAGATLSAAAMLGGALTTAAIGMVGSLLINALVPIRPPKIGRSDTAPVFGIEGARNRANPFGGVPQVLGRLRVAPNFGAMPYTEIVGDDQYLRLLFVWGVGPLASDEASLRIGETALSDFEGVEVEHRAGYPDDEPLTLYPGTVTEEALQVLLLDSKDGGATGPHVRNSGADADEIGLDFSWPMGLRWYRGSKNKTASTTVPLRVRYREVGATEWQTPNLTAHTFPAGWQSGDIFNFQGRTQKPIRHGMRWSVPRGQYEVEVTCTSAWGVDDGANRTYWTVLRTITDEDPIQSRVPVAKTALRIRATDQLNGVVDQLNGIVTTLGKDWDGEAWGDDQELTNPAALIRHVLQGKANAVAMPDERIDLASLEDFHEHCVENEFTFAQARAGGSVWEALADCAAAGRAAPAEVDGKWGVLIDRPQAVPVSHITPRNSSGFSVEKAFTELPHALRVPFVNERENYRTDERRVYRDGYDESNATLFEQMDLPGVTNPDQIWKLGRYRLAQGILQPERFTFRQDMEYLTYQRGDRARITPDVLLVGLATGRVKAVSINDDGEVTGLTLDEAVPMEAGKSYGLAIRNLGGSVTGQIVTEAGDQNEVTFSTPVPAVDDPMAEEGKRPAVERGDLFGFGLLGQDRKSTRL